MVLHIKSFDDISKAIHDCRQFQINLHCILVRTKIPIASTTFREEWKEGPLAFFAPRLGPFRDLVRQLPVIKKLNVRFYLPSNFSESFPSLRILSSLGIESVLVIDKTEPHWDLAMDLMSYAFFPLVPHAPIEPFQMLADEYRPTRRTDCGKVYFDDPTRYLHLDEAGRIAPSADALACGDLLAENFEQLDDLSRCPRYGKYLERWRGIFLNGDGCASCQAWRVCSGRFSHTGVGDHECAKFFIELMESVEHYQGLRQQKKVVWQA